MNKRDFGRHKMRLEHKPARIRVAVLFAIGALASACQSVPTAAVSAAGPAPDANISATADATFIVDCLLPGKIKKMGTSLTYLTPRRPVKASAQECELRGGEYVSFDRADYQTALRVWQPLADGGDAAAQTYVGMIYEKGLGTPPNFQQALYWYRKAAEQGYARAQYSVGYFFEQGLGVPKDPQAAVRWYRQAAGISGDEPSATVALLSEHEKAQLQQSTDAQRNELSTLNQQVSEKQTQLQQVSSDVTQAEQKLAEVKQRLASAKTEQRRVENKLAAQVKTREQIEQQLLVKIEELNALETKVSESGAATATGVADTQAQTELLTLRDRQAKLEQDLVQLKSENDRLATQQATTPATTSQTEQQSADAADAAKNATDELAVKQRQLAEVNAAIALQQKLAQSKGDELRALLVQVDQRKLALAQDLEQLNAQKAQADTQRIALEQQQKQLRSDINTAELQASAGAVGGNDKSAPGLTLAAADIPHIEIIDPVVPVVRSSGSMVTPILQIRSGVARRDVVGRVSSTNPVMLVSVNDERVSIGDGGTFTISVPVTENGTLVDAVAVDVKGNRGETKFVLTPEPQARGAVALQATLPDRERVLKQRPDLKFGNYYALLIGNNNYQKLPKLLTPKHDVESIGSVLREKYGFKDVRVLTDATRYDIITSLNQLRAKLTEDDNLVIYYAGHGELDKVNMSGQWLPIDAEPDNTANWISNGALTELVNAINAKRVLVVADSCYSGIMTRSALAATDSGQNIASRGTWLEKMLKKRSRTVLTSGGVAPVLDEGGGDHSVFARAFLQALNENDDVMEGQRLFRSVSATVASAADRYNIDQVPEYAPIRHAGHESGDFFLVPRL